MMKNTFLFWATIFAISLLSSCQKAELTTYKQHANIYFDLSGSDRDSIIYTFAYDMNKAIDTLYIPVQIMGLRMDQERSFTAYVEQDSSTAEPSHHFKTLDPVYPITSMAGRAFLPLIMYNVADLEEKSVSLIIKLKDNTDFKIENPTLIRARIILSAQLEQPHWWAMWMDDYSRVKHQLFILVTDQRSMTTNGLDAPRNLYFKSLLSVMLNNPFRWVTNNPAKGYELHPIDGTSNYFFFHKDNPTRKTLLRYNSGAGKHYFIDENGKEVR